jgi:hypothetical protein
MVWPEGLRKRSARVLISCIATNLCALLVWLQIHSAGRPRSVAWSRSRHLGWAEDGVAGQALPTVGYVTRPPSMPAGVAELVGPQAPLDPAHPGNSADWEPAAPWFRTQPVTSLFPTCQHPQWCDDLYDPAETNCVQRALWAHQNPTDCKAARYMVLESSWAPPQWPAGLGSSLHMHMYFLALALTDDRILVAGEGLDWSFGHPDVCGPDVGGTETSGRSIRPGVAGHRSPGAASNASSSTRRYLDCFFLPSTRCRPATAALVGAPVITALHQLDRVVRLHPYHSLLGTSFCELTVQASTPGLAAFRDKPPSWWYAQLAKFVVRPTMHTLTTLMWPLQQAAFYRTAGRLPHPLAAVFIRAGDKGSEAPLQTVHAHFAALAPLARKLNISDVYVGSDSAARLAEAIDAYSSTYRIHFINWQRPGGGLAMEDVKAAATSRSSSRMADLTRLALADLAITAQADVLVGSLSSNWPRLADELRRAGGKGRVPVGTPEGKLHYSWCEETGGVEVGSPAHMQRIAQIALEMRPPGHPQSK